MKRCLVKFYSQPDRPNPANNTYGHFWKQGTLITHYHTVLRVWTGLWDNEQDLEVLWK